MPRLVITVSENMHEALKEESNRTGVPMAALIRRAIEDWARRNKLDATDHVSWGGKRGEDEGQPAGVAAA